MSLRAVLSPDAVPERIEEYHAVVIDILRATTTVCAGLAAGVAGFRPVAELAAARRIGAGGRFPLAGERNGLAPEGFDLGNSPRANWSSYAGRTVVHCTTNGTRAIRAVASARSVALAAAVNFDTVVQHVGRLLEAGHQVLLVCAGRKDGKGQDDWYCAGRIAGELGGGLEPGRAADACYAAVGRYGREWLSALSDSAAGRALAGLGLEDDVMWAATANRCRVLPVMDGELITGSAES